MKKESKIFKALRYLHLSLVVVFALVAILGTGCGGGGSSGSSGGGGTAAVYPRFAYVANMDDNSVSTYAVENDTGRLRYQGKVDAGNDPRSVTVDPSVSYAYVANNLDDNVSQYTIAADGALTAMTPATVTAGVHPWSVTVDPSGSYAYVANIEDDSRLR